MTINLIHNEIVIYQPFSKDVVSLAIIGQTLLITYVLGLITYFA
jgi:hypothetical protein